MHFWMEVYTLSRKDGHLANLLQRFFGEEPQEVYSQFNASAIMHRDELIRSAMGAISFENVPENWNVPYMKKHLLLGGYFAISDTPMGILPLRCGVTGVSVWEEPTEYIINNPRFSSEVRGVIGEDGALVRLQYNYGNICDILDFYSAMLSACDSAISVNLINSKSSMIAECDSEAEAKSFKLMIDDIQVGKPAVFVRKGLHGKLNVLRAKDTYIATDIQDLKRTIKNDFLSLFGVNNANTTKRERLISDEVNANNQELEDSISHWRECIQEGLDDANRIFGYDLHIRFPLTEEVKDSGTFEGYTQSI